MHSKAHVHSSFAGAIWRPANVAFTILLSILFLILVVLFSTLTAQAQTYRVLHSFTGGVDGASPQAGLAIDAAGNLYGTTWAGGSGGLCSAPPGCGTLFKVAHAGSGWVTTPIYEFIGTNDGGQPIAPVQFAPDGTLYGSTYFGYGTLFRVTPPPATPSVTPFSFGHMTVLSFFDGFVFGPLGELAFDSYGNIYGTTPFGGPDDEGTVFEWSGGSLSVIYSGQHHTDGQTPEGGVTPDSSGNLYGIFSAGGPYQSGFVFELSPSQQGWTIQNLASFSGGYTPVSGLVFDSHGNLYGRRGGGVFQLVNVGRYWNINGIGNGGSSAPWSYPRLTVDSADNILGASYDGGAYGKGSVFKLTYSDGNWTQTTLHDFCPDAPICSEGAQPASNVVFDSQGHLFGTTTAGGAYGYGVVWEITP
jgi:uncharacterized repeat protein (TIGR03803 family)